jgi:hypothetical protein
VESGAVAKDSEVVKKAVEFILGKKQADGSICMKELGYQSYETSIAIMALAAVDREKYKAEIKKAADYIIDLGPGGGDEGGRIVAQGDLQAIIASKLSHTGEFLRKRFERKPTGQG